MRLMRLAPVVLENDSPRTYPQFCQRLEDAVFFNGREFAAGAEWIGAVLYPTYLGISFAERLADIPEFCRQVAELSGRLIVEVRGKASIALPGDAPLLGDWIEAGRFDRNRLSRRFNDVLGGSWRIEYTSRSRSVRNTVREVVIQQESEN